MQRPRPWSALSQLDRVWLYTRWSLYALLLGFNGSVLATIPADGAVVAGELAVTAVAFVVLARAIRSDPVTRALPPGEIAPLLVAAGALFTVAVFTLTGDARAAAVLIAMGSLAIPLGLLPDRRVPAAVVLMCGVLLWITGGSVASTAAGLAFGAVLVASSRVSTWLLSVVAELDAARA